MHMTIASWPVIASGLLGTLAPHLTDLLTKKHAPDWLKSLVNVALATLIGVLTTYVMTDTDTVQKTLANVGVAWVIALATHYADPLGTVSRVEQATRNFGIGTEKRPRTEIHAGVAVTESSGPPRPPSSPGKATTPRQSRLKPPRR